MNRSLDEMDGFRASWKGRRTRKTQHAKKTATKRTQKKSGKKAAPPTSPIKKTVRTAPKKADTAPFKSIRVTRFPRHEWTPKTVKNLFAPVGTVVGAKVEHNSWEVEFQRAQDARAAMEKYHNSTLALRKGRAGEASARLRVVPLRAARHTVRDRSATISIIFE